MKTIDLSQVSKILIIMMGGIGNMVFLTPALKALRKSLPSSKIVLLLGPYGAEKVFQGSNLIDKKIVLEPKKHKGLSGKFRLILRLRREKCSLSITSTGTNPLTSGFLCLLAGIKYRLGENIRNKSLFYNLKVPFDKGSHEVEGNIRLIKKLGIEVEDRTLFIQRTEEDKKSAREFFSQNYLKGRLVIGIHPGSGIHQAGFKRWPKERFARLADSLIKDLDAQVILFGGSEEKILTEEIKDLMKTSPFTLTGKTTLAQTAAFIEKCQLFISNDSGLLHVACAVGTPALGLFGPTDPLRTGPFSSSAIIVRKDLDCSPCYSGKPVSCSNKKCLEFITVKDVLREVIRILDKNER